MSGKAAGIFIVVAALIGGIAMYTLQIYAFYEDVPEDQLEVSLTLVATGTSEAIDASEIQAIDAGSSPIRYRACFRTGHSQSMLTETYEVYERAIPLTAPSWFDCFDAEEIGKALESEQAIAYLSVANVYDGIDRVVAIFDDGRGFAWHQLNEKFQE